MIGKCTSEKFDINAIYWASEASPTLGCSIEISRDIYMYMCVCRMSNHVESRESNTRMLKVSIKSISAWLFSKDCSGVMKMSWREN